MSDVEAHGGHADHVHALIEKSREQRERDEAAYEAFAATIKSKNKKYVHRRDPVAAMVSAAINARLRRSACPFVVISRIAYYAEDVFAPSPNPFSIMPPDDAVLPINAVAALPKKEMNPSDEARSNSFKWFSIAIVT